MTNEYDNESMPISDEEIAAAKESLRATVDIEELKRKNSAVLTTMMPPVLRVMIDEAAKTAGVSAADWARTLFAETLGFDLPQTEPKAKKARNERDVKVKQAAQRSLVADIIAQARAGQIDL